MTKAANILTLIGLAIIPLGLWASVIHQAHVYTLMLVCFIGLALYLPNKWLSGFGLYVSAWWVAVYLMTFTGSWIPELTNVTIDAGLFLIFAMLVYLAVYHNLYNVIIIKLPFTKKIIFNHKITLNTWYNAICISALIQCSIGILQHFNLDPVSWVLSHFVIIKNEFPLDTATGTLGNQNFLAAYLAISAPFFLRDKWFWFIPVIAYGLVVAHTSMAIMAVVIGMAYFVGGWRPALISIASVGLYATLINPHDGLHNERVGMWLDGLTKITHSWKSTLFGCGPGIQWKIGDQLHNEYLMVVWNYGLIGLSFMVGFILTISRQNRYLFTAFIIICIDIIGNHALHTTPTALLAVVIIALIERERTGRVSA